MADYLVQEDGVSKFTLEDASGSLLLESSPSGASITDTGLTVTDTLASLRLRLLSTTAATITDSIELAGQIHVAATGLTVTDSIQKTAAKFLSDTGATVTDSAVRSHTITLTDSAFGFGANNPPATPVLDDCIRADESILSDGGKWTRTAGFTSQLGLFSHAIYGLGLDSQMSFTAAGDLADAEAYVTLVTVNSNPHYSGVIVRQDPSSATGANCYGLIYKAGTGLQIIRYDGSGYPTVLATYAVSAGFHDTIGLRAEGATLTAWYKPNAGAWSKVLTVTDSTLTHGYIGARTDGFFQNTVFNFGGGGSGLRDTLLRDHPIALIDTGLNFSDGGIVFPVGPDIGVTIGSSLLKVARKFRVLTDTGLPPITDSLGKIVLGDSGIFSFSETLRSLRLRPLTATGATITDSFGPKHATHFIAATGLSLTDALVVSKNSHGASVSLTDQGLLFASPLSKSAHLFRAVPGPVSLPDIGANISDGISLAVFATTITATIVGGVVIFVVTVTAKRPPPRIKANFTPHVTGLGVSFTDTSTPGPDGPILNWDWHFGDGGTSPLQNPSHLYASAAEYLVTLKVTGTSPDGSDSITKRITTFVPSAAGFHIDAVIV